MPLIWFPEELFSFHFVKTFKSHSCQVPETDKAFVFCAVVLVLMAPQMIHFCYSTAHNKSLQLEA